MVSLSSIPKKKNTSTKRTTISHHQRPHTCRWRSRRHLRTKMEETDAINFWKGFIGDAEGKCMSASPQASKNLEQATQRRRAVRIRQAGSMKKRQEEHSLERRPLKDLPKCLQSTLAHVAASNNTSKVKKNGGTNNNVDANNNRRKEQHLGESLRNGAELAAALSFAMSSLPSLHTSGMAKRSHAAHVAFKLLDSKNDTTAIISPTTPVVMAEGGTGEGESNNITTTTTTTPAAATKKARRRQGQRKTRIVGDDVSVVVKEASSTVEEVGGDDDVAELLLSSSWTNIGSLGHALSQHYASLFKRIASQSITNHASLKSMKQAVQLSSSSPSPSNKRLPAQQPSSSSRVGASSSISSRLKEVSALLETFETIGAIQRRVQSRKKKTTSLAKSLVAVAPSKTSGRNRNMSYSRDYVGSVLSLRRTSLGRNKK